MVNEQRKNERKKNEKNTFECIISNYTDKLTK